MYTAKGDGRRVCALWLNFGVGKGLLCSPRLSWVICFAAVRLPPDCRGATGFPSGHRAALPGPGAGGGLLLHVATESKLGLRSHLQGKEQGVLTPLCSTKARPPVGQVKDRVGDVGPTATICALGSSIAADSTYCTSQSCLEGSARCCSPARAAPPGCPGSGGAAAAPRGAAPHASGLADPPRTIPGVTGLGGPCKALAQGA